MIIDKLVLFTTCFNGMTNILSNTLYEYIPANSLQTLCSQDMIFHQSYIESASVDNQKNTLLDPVYNYKL